MAEYWHEIEMRHQFNKRGVHSAVNSSNLLTQGLRNRLPVSATNFCDGPRLWSPEALSAVTAKQEAQVV